MPFTLAHPAAAVPIARVVAERLALSALVAGSMAPDFAYLVPGRAGGRFGHTLPGLLLFCLPLSLAALALFHGVVKRPVLLLLPDPVRERLGSAASPAGRLTWPRLLSISGLVLAGALTHVAWDSVTHEYGAGVQAVAALRTPVLTVGGLEVRVFQLLQYGSTLAGLGLLAYWAWAWLRRQPAGGGDAEALPRGVRRGLNAALVGVTLLLSVVSGASAAAAFEGIRRVQVFVVQSAVAGMRTSAILLLIYAASYVAITRHRSGPEGAGGPG